MAIDTVKIAMGQMLVEYNEADQNISRAVQMIEEAARGGCQVIVLPECLDLGWANPQASALAQPIPGQYSDRLCKAAEESKIYVVAGLTEKDHENVYNAAVLISPAGQLLLKHRKINLLPIERVYSIGDSLAVADTSFGKVGINICADNFPTSLALGHSLARMGAQMILSPSAWAVAADYDQQTEPYGGMWEQAYKNLAQLYAIPVVGVSNVGLVTEGAWSGYKSIGCSLAVGADGHVLLKGPYGEQAETVLYVDVEVRKREFMGTDMADMLKRKGYVGP